MLVKFNSIIYNLDNKYLNKYSLLGGTSVMTLAQSGSTSIVIIPYADAILYTVAVVDRLHCTSLTNLMRVTQ